MGYYLKLKDKEGYIYRNKIVKYRDEATYFPTPSIAKIYMARHPDQEFELRNWVSGTLYEPKPRYRPFWENKK